MNLNENKHSSPGHFVQKTWEYTSQVPILALVLIVLFIIVLQAAVS